MVAASERIEPSNRLRICRRPAGDWLATLDGYEYMKKSTTIIAILVFATGIVFAVSPFTNPKVAPTIPLPVAYNKALTLLGSDTNSFHCVDAKWVTNYKEWWFSFYNTNGVLKRVWGPHVINEGDPIMF
ncbi:MAG: hypothetical protein RL616_1924 [Verrucomicrobiota bacterium]|jgi:hypothetical protein